MLVIHVMCMQILSPPRRDQQTSQQTPQQTPPVINRSVTTLSGIRLASLSPPLCSLTGTPAFTMPVPLFPCLCRYLSEEVLELQVWAGTVPQSTRPTAGDVLIGSVYVLLSDVLVSQSREIRSASPYVY